MDRENRLKMYAYLTVVCEHQHKEKNVCQKTCLFAYHYKKKGTCSINSVLHGLCEGEDQITFAEEALSKYGELARTASYEEIIEAYRANGFGNSKGESCRQGDCKTCGYKGWSTSILKCPHFDVFDGIQGLAYPEYGRIMTAARDFADGKTGSPLPPDFL